MVSFGDEDPTWLTDEGNSSCGASVAFKFKADLTQMTMVSLLVQDPQEW